MNVAYNMDCLAAMREMPDKAFDLAVVDPPYGINIAKLNMGAGTGARWSKIENRLWTPKDWDTVPDQEYFDQLIRVSKN